jgi:hypothetical protein
MKPKLTERDIAICKSVYTYRYLSVSQIKQLHFASPRPAWRRLQALTQLGFLKAFTTPNMQERIFYLDKKGAEIVAIELQTSFEDLAWHRHMRTPKDYHFLKHFLAINDFRILLTLACQQQPEITLLDFIPEHIGEQTKEGFVKKYLRDSVNGLSHTPDGVFSLEKSGKSALFFVEIDRGIEVVSDPEKGLLKAIIFYLHYWCSRNWLRYQEDFKREFQTFRVLIVTTSQVRLQNIREIVTGLLSAPPDGQRYLWCTLNNWLRVDTVFDPIWQSLDKNDDMAYRIG